MTQEFTEYQRRVRAIALPVLCAWNRGGGEPAAAGVDPDPIGRCVSIATATAAAGLLIDDDPLLYPGLVAGIRGLIGDGRSLAIPPVTDTAGQTRDIYGPFALHLHLAAFGSRYESLPPGVWSRCEDALEDAVRPAHTIERYVDTPPEPALVPEVLWMALCVCEHAQLVSRDVSVDIADSVVRQIVTRAGPGHPGGALHEQDHRGAKSLDGWIYQELSGLHALANLAVLRRNRQWARRVEQIAGYHLEHTQPDHVTNQPWGVFGFAWSHKTRSFADQQVHDAQAHLARSTAAGPLADPVPAMLLADAAAVFGAFGVS